MANGMALSMAARKRPGFSPRRSSGGGAGEDAAGHELGDRADGRTRRVRRNLLEGPAVLAVGHVVHLDHLAGGLGPVAVLPPVRPGVVEAASAPGLEPPFAEGRGLDATVGDDLAEDAPDRGHGQADAIPGQHRLQSGLAHVGALGPQLEHGPVVGIRPPPPLDGAGAGAPRLERRGAAAPEGFAPVVVGALGEADGAQGVAAAHALDDHLVDEFEGAQAPFGGPGRLGVDPPVLELRSPAASSAQGLSPPSPSGQFIGLSPGEEVPKCF